MNKLYHKSERLFEKFVDAALRAFGSSVTFILAFILVIIYLVSSPFASQSFHNSIYDIILCITFLGFFIIQKSFNKYSRGMNLKVNELVSSNDLSSNRMVNIETKTEAEMQELEKHYTMIADESAKSGELQTTKSIEQILDRQNEDAGKNENKWVTTDKDAD